MHEGLLTLFDGSDGDDDHDDGVRVIMVDLNHRYSSPVDL